MHPIVCLNILSDRPVNRTIIVIVVVVLTVPFESIGIYC
jgi:hypothetical protein